MTGRAAFGIRAACCCRTSCRIGLSSPLYCSPIWPYGRIRTLFPKQMTPFPTSLPSGAFILVMVSRGSAS